MITIPAQHGGESPVLSPGKTGVLRVSSLNSPSMPVDPDTLSRVLAIFQPVSLGEIEDASLMDRKEEKFLLSEDQASDILRTVSGDYHILEIDGTRMGGYETLYFDTDQYFSYLQHHNGKLHRYKIRSRRYLASDLSYFEIKQKSNTGRSMKQRIRTNGMVTRIESYLGDFLSLGCPYDTTGFRPQIFNTYSRITLVSPDHAERVTMDYTLLYYHKGNHAGLPGMVVAEVKTPGRGARSHIRTLLREMGIRPSGFSKYCIGVSLLCPEIKKNVFKPRLLQIAGMQSGAGGVQA